MDGTLPQLGFGLPVAGPWATPTAMAHVARRADELGYASLWTFQRVLDPVGADLGASHRSVHDSIVALSYVAGLTERIGLGTATLCAPFVAPALLAKATASLDVLSGGRLTVGLGMGWVPEEFVAAGVDFERRGPRLEEYLRCLVALWTEDPVEFAGEFYTVPRAHVAPHPVQQPHPPILLGGTAEPALRRAGRLASGWIGSSTHDLTRIGSSVELVRAGARDAGRDPDALRILVRVVVELTDHDGGVDRRPLHGSREQILDDLAALRRRGVTEVFVDLNLSPHVGGADASGDDAARSAVERAALESADCVLEALAPVHLVR